MLIIGDLIKIAPFVRTEDYATPALRKSDGLQQKLKRKRKEIPVSKSSTRRIMALIMLMIATALFAAKPTIENVYFRDGFDKFPTVGKGTITLESGKKIKGEFRQGMVVKMGKYQFYDAQGKVHQIEPKDVKAVVFHPDEKWQKAVNGPDIQININLPGFVPKLEPKSLPYNISQFKDFDQAKNWETVYLERVNGQLMVEVNHGFDSKVKVFVPLGRHTADYGYVPKMSEMVHYLIFGGGEAGKEYKKMYVKKGDQVVVVKHLSVWGRLVMGHFTKKEFVTLFGDDKEFMDIYTKWWKRKPKYLPEYVWVYNQK